MSWNQAEDGPYDFARERFEAELADPGDYVEVNGSWYDRSEVPSGSDLVEEEASWQRGQGK